jgi:hypothetical protein
MQTFTLDCWYFYSGANEKDFDTVTITAENFEKAKEIAQNESNVHYFKIELKNK